MVEKSQVTKKAMEDSTDENNGAENELEKSLSNDLDLLRAESHRSDKSWQQLDTVHSRASASSRGGADKLPSFLEDSGESFGNDSLASFGNSSINSIGEADGEDQKARADFLSSFVDSSSSRTKQKGTAPNYKKVGASYRISPSPLSKISETL